MIRDLDERGLPEGYSPRDGLEISPREAHDILESGGILIDIREPEELQLSSINGATHIPMGDIPTRIHEIEADEDTPIALICHAGQRSLMATLFLKKEGLEGARSVIGGIDLWSLTVDESVPRY